MKGTAQKLIVVGVIVGLLLVLALPAAAHLTGAVWTTTATGAKVNANLYDQKCPPLINPCTTPPLVPFLSGGPNFASPTRWVPDGDYYFQVTDPPGKVLLSSDSIAERMFTVATDGAGKKYVIYGGSHITCTDSLSGLVTIALCPFYDTPNNGGVYKLWITRVSDYNPADSGSRFGFIPSLTKTDNFKVKRLASVWGKKVDDQGNPLEGVHIILYSVQKIRGVQTLVRIADTCTDGNGEFSFTNLSVGKYAVDEDLNLSQPPIPAGCIDYSTYTRVSPLGPIYFTITRADTGSARTGPGAPKYIGQFVNQPSGPPPQATLSGFKFLDEDGDGVLDPGEPPLADWEITLYEKTGNGTWQLAHDADGNLVTPNPRTTGADGAYNFGHLAVDRVYRICETLKPGWLQTAPTTGNPGPYVVAPPDADVTVDVVDQCFVVAFGAGAPDGTVVSDLRFGNKLAKLCVQKLQDGTGTPVAGFEFRLYEADGITPATDGFGDPVPAITTGADGTACWENLLAGCYVVVETGKNGWRPVDSDSQSVCLDPGEEDAVTFTNHAICIGLTPGYWKNWRNHYTDAQFTSLLSGTIAADIAAADGIFAHWDANPDDYLTILQAFLLADQLTLNLTQDPSLPNPSGGSLVPECNCAATASLSNAITSALDILAAPGLFSRDYVLIVKDELAAYAQANCP
jgi:hypothetical protein